MSQDMNDPVVVLSRDEYPDSPRSKINRAYNIIATPQVISLRLSPNRVVLQGQMKGGVGVS